MGRTRRNCPVIGCKSTNLVRLANHLDQVHHINQEERSKILANMHRPSEDEEHYDFSDDGEMSTTSNSKEDIFSSSDDEGSEHSEEDSDDSCDSDEEPDPWGELIHEAASIVRLRYDELVQSFHYDDLDEINGKRQAFEEILPQLQKTLENVYLDRLQWIWEMKKDPIHTKIMETRKRLRGEEGFDQDEALTAAVKRRKFLLRRMLEAGQHYNEDDETE